MKDEILIYTKEDLDMMKEKALELIQYLPDEPKSALIIVGFLKERMEETIGLRIQVKVREGGD